MSDCIMFKDTSAWMDTVDLALCLFIYEVCKDRQFYHLSGSDFVNFMNLKPTSRAVTVRPKENLRICYMVLSVSLTIKPRERARQWAEEFLQSCGISKSYYDKHRNVRRKAQGYMPDELFQRRSHPRLSLKSSSNRSVG